MKILIIEDELEMIKVITTSLQQENYVVENAMNYEAALEKIACYEYDCILLDIMLPGGNGLDILAALKKLGKKNNVIILSAKDSVEDKVKGLDLGADDYLAKPFHLSELTARVKSIIRRKSLDGQDILTLANVNLDITNRIASVNAVPIALHRKEFDILLFLLNNKNRLIGKTTLAEHIWGDQIDQADSLEFIYSQIKNLRKKLKEAAAEVEIQAVYGIGYKMIEI